MLSKNLEGTKTAWPPANSVAATPLIIFVQLTGFQAGNACVKQNALPARADLRGDTDLPNRLRSFRCGGTPRELFLQFRCSATASWMRHFTGELMRLTEMV